MVMSLARGTIRSGLILLNALRLPGDAGLCLCTVFAQQEEAQLRSLQKQLVNVSTTLQFTTGISYFSSLFYSAVRRPILP